VFGRLEMLAALAQLPHVELEQLPRLADFVTWITAAEPSLGLEHGTLLKAFLANRHQANGVALEASLLAAPIMKLIENGVWSGTAEQLLRRLHGRGADEASPRMASHGSGNVGSRPAA
jgi:hypothetical protein